MARRGYFMYPFPVLRYDWNSDRILSLSIGFSLYV